MELNLYIKEGEELKYLKVPIFVVKNLLRDRLSNSELNRIQRFAEKTNKPEIFKAGSVVVDFEKRTAQCFQSGLRLKDLDVTWDVEEKQMNLLNY